MLSVRLKPENELFIQFIKQIGPMLNGGIYCNDQYFSYQIMGYQYTLITRQFNEKLMAWNAEQVRTEELFDLTMKALYKNYAGFEIHELYLPILFTLSTNATTYSKQQYLDQQKKEMIALSLMKAVIMMLLRYFQNGNLRPKDN